jgi:RNA 2',3'-cyclic 3'-phosphodiesterase
MSDRNPRLFLALDIPEEVKEIISAGMEGLRDMLPGARWVKTGNLHITLKFIGDYEEARLESLVREIRASVERCTGFMASLGGCGAFPSAAKTRILWVGMSTAAEEARAVARKLDARLERVGVKREKRPFKGHITLARMKKPGDCTCLLKSLASGLEGLSDHMFYAGEVVLYRSILGPESPTYIALERMPLGGKPGEKG